VSLEEPFLFLFSLLAQFDLGAFEVVQIEPSGATRELPVPQLRSGKFCSQFGLSGGQNLQIRKRGQNKQAAANQDKCEKIESVARMKNGHSAEEAAQLSLRESFRVEAESRQKGATLGPFS